MKKLTIIAALVLGIGAVSQAQTTTVQSSAFTVQTSLAVELRDAICAEFGYQENIVNGQGQTVPNPETKNQFSQRMMDKYLKQWARNVILSQRKKQAAAATSEQTTGLEDN